MKKEELTFSEAAKEFIGCTIVVIGGTVVLWFAWQWIDSLVVTESEMKVMIHQELCEQKISKNPCIGDTIYVGGIEIPFNY